MAAPDWIHRLLDILPPEKGKELMERFKEIHETGEFVPYRELVGLGGEEEEGEESKED